MDDLRFDRLTRRFHAALSRRGMLRGGLAAWAALGLTASAAPTDAKRKKKRRRKRRCIPTCANRFCGPTSCGTGSCGTCGSCKDCEGGSCFPKANGAPCGGPCEECQGGTCIPKAAATSCGDCQECQGAACVNVCESREVCFEGACEDLSGGCTGADDRCGNGQIGECFIGNTGGNCVTTDGGAPFCQDVLACGNEGDPICQTDADCRAQGFGDRAQCITACAFCPPGARGLRALSG